jgi:hypothetical protein
MTVAHNAGIPAEEWLMPFFTTAGAALVGMRAVVGSSATRRAQRGRSPSSPTSQSHLGRTSTKEH